jgi:hypothetical protein
MEINRGIGGYRWNFFRGIIGEYSKGSRPRERFWFIVDPLSFES